MPHDQYSTENAILVKHGQRWPLLIDPERQAYKWICQMEGSKLRQISATDANYLKTVEYSLQFGESILLQVIQLQHKLVIQCINQEKNNAVSAEDEHLHYNIGGFELIPYLLLKGIFKKNNRADFTN